MCLPNNFERIHNAEEAIAYIKKTGFLPLFKNDIPGFSLEERTFSGDWWSGDAQRDPWEWRKIMAGSGEMAYGKFFDKRAGFGKGGEKNFEGTVADLEMRMYLCISDFRQRKNKRGENYGWSIAVYSTPEHLWGYDYVTSAYQEEPTESWDRIVGRM